MDAALLDSIRALETSSELESQIACLRCIKNDVVGHGLRKELIITNGVLASLERILATAARSAGKRQENGDTQGKTGWGLEDEARLQATLIVDTLAHEGPAFVSPIMLSDVTLDLFNALNPPEVPARIVIASLRALNSLAASSTLAEVSPVSTTPSRLALQAFSKTNITRLIHLLKTPLETSDGRQIVQLTANLIATACQDDVSRVSLAKAGTLEVLGSLLADYAIHNASSACLERLRTRAPHLSENAVTKVLNALSAVIKSSNYRAYRLLLASSFRRTFARATRHASYYTKGSSKRYKVPRLGSSDLLPEVLVTSQKSVTFGSQHFQSSHSSLEGSLGPQYPFEGLEVWESFYSWLIHLARSLEAPAARLAALRLQALLYAALDNNSSQSYSPHKVKGRERLVALLAVPVAVKLVQDAVTSMNSLDDKSEDAASLREEACDVLALLVKPSPELQKAAVDAGAVKHVSLMLRKSFDPIMIPRPMWSAEQKESVQLSNKPSAQMGEHGLPPKAAHIMKIRAGALRALAAVASREDLHRKAIIDQGMVSYVFDCLTPYSDTALVAGAGTKMSCSYNTVPVLIAACEAATSLSRSVSLLRTSLIDAGIAKPVLALLRHPNPDIKVAATNVCCNLILDFSPMRQDIMDSGALKTFCEHARRSHSVLRVVSLWVLKHLVLNAPKEVKIEALEELGPGWLVQAISGEATSDPIPAPTFGMSTPNAAGEQVDLLNAPDTPEMDIDSPTSLSEADDSDSGSPQQVDVQSGLTYQTSTMRSTLKPNLNALSTLRTLRERETSPLYRARQEVADVQEQAIDIIRNLLNGDDAATMVDHLNSTIGLTRLFELLQAKLEGSAPSRSQTTLRFGSSFGSNGNGSGNGGGTGTASPAQQLSPPTDAVVHSAVHILVQISAASSKHKQMLIAQKPLLNAWLPHFAHRDGQVRVACVWTVINLTWVEDQGDRENARQRALELRACGVEERVRSLQSDGELDIRERCKVAVRQLDELLLGAAAGRAR